MRFIILLVITWCSLMDCKPLHKNDAVQSIIRNSISQSMTEKADAIDNLLGLLSEIDLPSICAALETQQRGGSDKMATVDAILAEAAKSQAMTFIPTNLPETSQVTRPGMAPANFASQGRGGRRQFQDGKQASQEVAISRPEGKLDDLSLDIAAALTANKQLQQKPTKPKNVDVSINAFSGYKKSLFPRAKFPMGRFLSSTLAPSKSTGAQTKTTMSPPKRTMASRTTMSPSRTTMTPPRTTMEPSMTTGSPPKTTLTPPKTTMTPPKTTMTPPKTTMTPSKTTMTPPKTTMTPPKTTMTPPKTTMTPPKTTITPTKTTMTPPKTTTIVTKASKKDTTIPTLASDMMLPDSLFGESGDGENLVEKAHPTGTYTTLKMDEEITENKIYNPFEKKYKNIFQNRKTKDYELNKDSPFKLPKSTSSPEAKDLKTSSSEVRSSVYKTFVPDSTNVLSEQTTDMTEFTPTVEDDLGWGFTLPQNTTFGEFMFGNLTLNQTLSDELASILNSTVPVDFLISNDTIYNEFMSILNKTLVTDDSYTPEPVIDFDMGVSETGDITNIMDYISNRTEKLSTFTPEVNGTTTSPINSTTMEMVLDEQDNSSHIIDSNEIVLNSSLEADYSTYSAKIINASETKTSSAELKSTFPSENGYIHTKFPEYPPRRGDEEVKSQTMSRPTDFTAGDYYYPQTEQDDVDMLAGSNNFIEHDDVESQFKHSGFAPLNNNHHYKVNARNAGLTYLGFDFKKTHQNPFTPNSAHGKSKVEGAVQSLTKQKTIWSEPTQKDITFPTGYTCPGLFGYFGDAHDCKAFFICSWGVPYRFHCPPGTVWSTEESVCNWSRDVTCQESR